MNEVIKIDTNKFKQEFLEASLPAAMLFKSPGCPHCVRMLPVFETSAQNHSGQMKFGVVDVTETPQIAVEYGVLSIPVIVFLKEGREIDRIIGFVPLEKLEDSIASALTLN